MTKYRINATKLHTQILDKDGNNVCTIVGKTWLGFPHFVFRYGLSVAEKQAIEKSYYSFANKDKS